MINMSRFNRQLSQLTMVSLVALMTAAYGDGRVDNLRMGGVTVDAVEAKFIFDNGYIKEIKAAKKAGVDEPFYLTTRKAHRDWTLERIIATRYGGGGTAADALTIATLKADKLTLTGRLKTLTDDLNLKIEELIQKNSDNLRLIKDLEYLETLNTKLKKILSNNNSTITELEDDIVDLEAHLKKLIGENETLKLNLQEYVEDLEAANKKIESLKKDKAAIEKSGSSGQLAEQKRLQAELDKTLKELAALKIARSTSGSGPESKISNAEYESKIAALTEKVRTLEELLANAGLSVEDQAKTFVDKIRNGLTSNTDVKVIARNINSISLLEVKPQFDQVLELLINPDYNEQLKKMNSDLIPSIVDLLGKKKASVAKAHYKEVLGIEDTTFIETQKTDLKNNVTNLNNIEYENITPAQILLYYTANIDITLNKLSDREYRSLENSVNTLTLNQLKYLLSLLLKNDSNYLFLDNSEGKTNAAKLTNKIYQFFKEAEKKGDNYKPVNVTSADSFKDVNTRLFTEISKTYGLNPIGLQNQLDSLEEDRKIKAATGAYKNLYNKLDFEGKKIVKKIETNLDAIFHDSDLVALILVKKFDNPLITAIKAAEEVAQENPKFKTLIEKNNKALVGVAFDIPKSEEVMDFSKEPKLEEIKTILAANKKDAGPLGEIKSKGISKNLTTKLQAHKYSNEEIKFILDSRELYNITIKEVLETLIKYKKISNNNNVLDEEDVIDDKPPYQNKTNYKKAFERDCLNQTFVNEKKDDKPKDNKNEDLPKKDISGPPADIYDNPAKTFKEKNSRSVLITDELKKYNVDSDNIKKILIEIKKKSISVKQAMIELKIEIADLTLKTKFDNDVGLLLNKPQFEVSVISVVNFDEPIIDVMAQGPYKQKLGSIFKNKLNIDDTLNVTIYKKMAEGFTAKESIDLLIKDNRISFTADNKKKFDDYFAKPLPEDEDNLLNKLRFAAKLTGDDSGKSSGSGDVDGKNRGDSGSAGAGDPETKRVAQQAYYDTNLAVYGNYNLWSKDNKSNDIGDVFDEVDKFKNPLSLIEISIIKAYMLKNPGDTPSQAAEMYNNDAKTNDLKINISEGLMASELKLEPAWVMTKDEYDISMAFKAFAEKIEKSFDYETRVLDKLKDSSHKKASGLIQEIEAIQRDTFEAASATTIIIHMIEHPNETASQAVTAILENLKISDKPDINQGIINKFSTIKTVFEVVDFKPETINQIADTPNGDQLSDARDPAKKNNPSSKVTDEAAAKKAADDEAAAKKTAEEILSTFNDLEKSLKPNAINIDQSKNDALNLLKESAKQAKINKLFVEIENIVGHTLLPTVILSEMISSRSTASQAYEKLFKPKDYPLLQKYKDTIINSLSIITMKFEDTDYVDLKENNAGDLAAQTDESKDDEAAMIKFFDVAVRSSYDNTNKVLNISRNENYGNATLYFTNTLKSIYIKDEFTFMIMVTMFENDLTIAQAINKISSDLNISNIETYVSHEKNWLKNLSPDFRRFTFRDYALTQIYNSKYDNTYQNEVKHLNLKTADDQRKYNELTNLLEKNYEVIEAKIILAIMFINSDTASAAVSKFNEVHKGITIKSSDNLASNEFRISRFKKLSKEEEITINKNKFIKKFLQENESKIKKFSDSISTDSLNKTTFELLATILKYGELSEKEILIITYLMFENKMSIDEVLQYLSKNFKIEHIEKQLGSDPQWYNSVDEPSKKLKFYYP